MGVRVRACVIDLRMGDRERPRNPRSSEVVVSLFLVFSMAENVSLFLGMICPSGTLFMARRGSGACSRVVGARGNGNGAFFTVCFHRLGSSRESSSSDLGSIFTCVAAMVSMTKSEMSAYSFDFRVDFSSVSRFVCDVSECSLGDFRFCVRWICDCIVAERDVSSKWSNSVLQRPSFRGS